MSPPVQSESAVAMAPEVMTSGMATTTNSNSRRPAAAERRCRTASRWRTSQRGHPALADQQPGDDQPVQEAPQPADEQGQDEVVDVQQGPDGG